jgi:hypothetical protein
MGAGMVMVAARSQKGQIVAEPASHKAFMYGLFREST